MKKKSYEFRVKVRGNCDNNKFKKNNKQTDNKNY